MCSWMGSKSFRRFRGSQRAIRKRDGQSPYLGGMCIWRTPLAIDLHEAQVREQARMRQVKAGKENGKGMNNSLGPKEPKLSSDSGGAPASPSDSAEPQPADQPKPQKGRTAAKGITTMNTLTNHQRQIIKEQNGITPRNLSRFGNRNQIRSWNRMLFAPIGIGLSCLLTDSLTTGTRFGHDGPSSQMTPSRKGADC